MISTSDKVMFTLYAEEFLNNTLRLNPFQIWFIKLFGEDTSLVYFSHMRWEIFHCKKFLAKTYLMEKLG